MKYGFAARNCQTFYVFLAINHNYSGCMQPLEQKRVMKITNFAVMAPISALQNCPRSLKGMMRIPQIILLAQVDSQFFQKLFLKEGWWFRSCVLGPFIWFNTSVLETHLNCVLHTTHTEVHTLIWDLRKKSVKIQTRAYLHIIHIYWCVIFCHT